MSTITISGSGELISTIVNNNIGSATDVIIDGFTSIGTSAFVNRNQLTSITIPNTVTSIGVSAFDGCTSLTTITMPINSNFGIIKDYTFQNCQALTSITIPNSVTSIGKYAFNACFGLTSISIPVGVTTIGASAFNNCKKFTSITIPSNVTSIGDSAFNNCLGLTTITMLNNDPSFNTISTNTFQNCQSLTSITIPNSVTRIDNGAFNNCTSLTTITMPNNNSSVLSIIGNNTFQNCQKLTSIAIPNSVTSIGVYAFNSCYALTSITMPINGNFKTISNGTFLNCQALTTITIPSNVTSISDSAFYNCINCTPITIPVGVTTIGQYAFYNCQKLTSITIPAGVTSIGAYAFNSCQALTSITMLNNDPSFNTISTGTFLNCAVLTSITIPNSVTRIGVSAFQGCNRLSSIHIPVGVTHIEENAFNGCAGLTWIDIPNSVTSIGGRAFNDCISLKLVSIPNLVTTIVSYTFWNCPSLKSIFIPSSVTSIGASAFSYCTSLTSIFIPNSVTSTSIATNAFSSSGLTSVYLDVSNGLGITVFPQTNYNFYGKPSVTIYKSTNSSPPTITNVTFAGGISNTDSLLTITGTYLTPETLLYFADILVTPIVSNTSSQITCYLPANTGFIKVLTVYGMYETTTQYTVRPPGLLLSTFITTDQNNAYGTGANHFGMLALGITVSSVNTLRKIQLPTGKTISKICSGGYFAMFLMTDGTLYGVGKNSDGVLGLGNNNSEIRNLTQVSIPSEKIIKNISCGSYHCLVLMTDGTLYGTGYNRYGQLGLGDNINKNVLTEITTIPLLKTIKTVLTGDNHTIVLMTDGTLYGSGSNGYGQLGLGSAPSVSVFTQIPPPNGKIIKSVSCGGNSVIVLMTDNTLYVTGKNSNGQLGIAQDNKTDIYVLTQPDTTFQAGKTIQTIFGGSFSTIITMTDNTVYGAGIGNLLGLSDSNDRTVFTLLSMPTNKIMQTVAGGNAHNIFLMKDGTLYGSGNNSYGQLGLGNNNNRTVLTQITVPNNEFVTSIMNDNRDLNIVCFKEDTKILTNNGYIPIQYLRPGDLVKTFTNGYLPISMIGVSKMHHSKNNKIAKNALYKCTNAKFPEVFEDLIITGCHGILVDNFANDAQIEQTRNVLGNIFITDKKYRLPACLDDRAVLYEKYGTFNIYHIALENPNYYTNYGIYANGLLVETCSKRYLKELSSMKLLE